MKHIIVESEDNETFTSISPEKRIQLEADYVENNISCFKNISKFKYSKALDSYEKCYKIAVQLGDNFKINDSLCNIAITNFYIGNIKASLEKFQTLNNYYSTNIDVEHNLKETKLQCKVYSNLIIVYLSLGKINEAKECLDNLMDCIKDQEELNDKKELIKDVIYIFFRLESLKNIGNQDLNNSISIKESDINNPAKHKEVIEKIIHTFYYFLQSNDIDKWIQCLNESVEYFKLLKDYNGLIFSIFNLQTSIYNKSKNINDNSSVNITKNKVYDLLKILIGDKEIDDQEVETILDNIKKKMQFSVQLFKRLSILEQDIMKIKPRKKSQHKKKGNLNSTNQNNEDNRDNSTIIKILIKFSIKYLDKVNIDKTISSKVKNHLTIILKEIEDNNIDPSKLKLKNLSQEIFNGINTLFSNLNNIARKIKAKYAILKLKRYSKACKDILNQNKISHFQADKYNSLMEGQELEKLNYKTDGTKSHCYKLDYEGCAIKRTKRDSNKFDQTIEFNEMKKITFGIYSWNLTKKLSYSDCTIKTWTYFSFITSERSIDLHSKTKNVDCWFYGFFHYFKQYRMCYKISSCRKYLLHKVKSNIIYNLETMRKSNRINNRINNQDAGKIKDIYEGEIQKSKNTSFVKVLLLHKKINQLK